MSTVQADRGAREDEVAQGRWRIPKFALTAALLALTGVGVALYPGVAAWFSQAAQSQVVRSVEGEVAAEPSSSLSSELDRARAYNEALSSGALLPEQGRLPESTGVASGVDVYEDLLNASSDGAMGRLRLPAIDLDLPIYHGTDDATLEHGVGHLEGTSLPVGGASQHSVLTAHRGLATAELFTRLDEVRPGDLFSIEVFGEVLAYRVSGTQVVRPDEGEALYPTFGKDLVTLVTCTPLGINSHRILVTGERVTPTPEAVLDDAGTPPEIPGFPWWAVGLGAAVVLLTAYVGWAGRPRRDGLGTPTANAGMRSADTMLISETGAPAAMGRDNAPK
ncbi:class C sortase [Leucobacter sp. USHLN153]|uniref:class C sortase n=1 Tax=Leucobacter sp. USHLN153 TaxID=3081268 RepID=UPI003018FD50